VSDRQTTPKPDQPGRKPPTPVTLALIQMRCDRGPEKNLSHAIELIGRAAGAGAQLVVLPELFCTPYFCREKTPEVVAAAKQNFSVTIPGPTTEALAKAAKANGVVLVGGSVFEKAGEQYFNSSPVFDADGKLLGVYRKTHIPNDEGFWEQDYFSHGDTGITVFDTALGKVAVQICYDQWFPEGARLAALQGAEFLVYPTAIGDVDFAKPAHQGDWREMWTAAQAGHAVCNHLFVAAANRVGQEGQTNFWGGSFVADPCGRVIQKAGVAEEVVLVRCDRTLIEVMKQWRFFIERRPERYAGLTKPVN
jgi:predicted amidohydrolase